MMTTRQTPFSLDCTQEPAGEQGGEAFVSNAVADRYALRACIVNFHTSDTDVNALPEIRGARRTWRHTAMTARVLRTPR